MLYGTGFGPTNPAIAPGEVVSELEPAAQSGHDPRGSAPSAQVLYAGMTGVGLYQFNVVVPDLPAGDYPVVAEVAGVRTASAARLRVQQ